MFKTSFTRLSTCKSPCLLPLGAGCAQLRATKRVRKGSSSRRLVSSHDVGSLIHKPTRGSSDDICENGHINIQLNRQGNVRERMMSRERAVQPQQQERGKNDIICLYNWAQEFLGSDCMLKSFIYVGLYSGLHLLFLRSISCGHFQSFLEVRTDSLPNEC